MRIICLNIKAFGKIANATINLTDGVNVVQNVNGYGKTTVANFVRAMLYGFTYSTKNKVKDSARFAPWGASGKFGGSMLVTHNGQNYRIERFFGGTKAQEELLVLNADTNKPINLHCQPGEYFLGLTADSFDRSAYFPQEAVELSSNDNFDTKLANLVENGEEDYLAIQDKLRKYKKDLRYEKGNGGEIYQLESKRDNLQRQLAVSESNQRRKEEITSQLQQTELWLQEKNQRQADINAKTLQLQQQLADAQPTEAEKMYANRLAELQMELARVPAQIEQDFAKSKGILKQIAAEKAKPQPKQRRFGSGSVALFCIAALAVVLAVTLGFALNKWCFVIAVFGLLAVVPFARKKPIATLQATEVDHLVTDYYHVAAQYVDARNCSLDEVVALFENFVVQHRKKVMERDNLLPLAKNNGQREKIEREIANLQWQRQQLSSQIGELMHRKGALVTEQQNLVINSVALQEQIVETEQQLAVAKRKYLVAETVSQLLAQAKDNLSGSYLPKLCKRCQELLCFVTNSNYQVQIDRNFALHLRQNEQTKPMAEFSRGVREITLLCFRIALSELLFDGAIPFLIVDDAFVNYDEPNFVRATELLNVVAQGGQVVYLTCHKRLGNLPQK